MYNEFKRQLTALYGRMPGAVLAALSGGSDSVALLALCRRLRDEEGVRLYALHFNHHIRGEEAERDAHFCAELCKEWNIAFRLAEADIPALAEKEKKGLEECGRVYRYRALEAYRIAEEIDCILTAHNADDLLETVLFRMARGTALKGLGGIPPKNGAIIRPMLPFTKEEIERFCADGGLSYVTDSSNADCRYHRNRIRAEALPALRAVRADVSAHTLALCESLREDEDFICTLLPEERLNAAGLKALHPSLLRRYVLREYNRYLETVQKNASLEAVHLTALIDAVRKERFGASFSLPGLVQASYTANGFYFSEDKTEKEGYECPLFWGENPIPGTNYSIFCGNQKKFSEFSDKNGKIHNLFIQVAGKNDTINKLFYMRSRRAGDRISFGGMTREISKLVAARTADPQLRRSYPLICDAQGILWLPGYPPRAGSETMNDQNKKIYLWIGEKTR